jgi:hypothetical protein
VNGAGSVTALVLLECTAGAVAVAAWTQSWTVVRRGHFRIVAWSALVLGCLAALAGRGAWPAEGPATTLLVVTVAGAALYLAVQYSRTDLPGTVVGLATGALGVASLVAVATLLAGWPAWLAALELVAGGALVGSVVNGMLLGHWYLNQPGLKPWALGRLTTLALGASAVTAVLGVAAATRLSDASTEGAVLGLPGFGESFGGIFFAVWLSLVAFTAVVVWMARRCVALRSIQSATGLYYVALLSAATSEFLVRYLMVNSGAN